uniref:Uncharacterized protein n=1 Tax=Meloidogyne hapla TaxID=6305 RepID=A0A1I8BKS8_MELHA
MIRNIKKLNNENEIKLDLKEFIGFENKFIKKYEHFMLISCISEDNKNLEKFCFFIESTIRIQLINLIIDNNIIRYTHFWEESINKCIDNNGKKFVDKLE